MLQKRLQEIGDSKMCPIAFLERDGKFLYGFRHYKEGSFWTVPGGRCEEGENLEQALRREVKEEIGVDDLEILDYLGEVPGANEGDRVIVFFLQNKPGGKVDGT